MGSKLQWSKESCQRTKPKTNILTDYFKLFSVKHASFTLLLFCYPTGQIEAIIQKSQHKPDVQSTDLHFPFDKGSDVILILKNGECLQKIVL